MYYIINLFLLVFEYTVIVSVICLAFVHLYFIYKMLAIKRNKKHYFKSHKIPHK